MHLFFFTHRCCTTPATPAALLSYLLGPWTLTKTLTYTRGGLSGTFRGDAAFVPLAGSPRVLAYEEKGKVTLEPDMESFDARRSILKALHHKQNPSGRRDPSSLGASKSHARPSVERWDQRRIDGS